MQAGVARCEPPGWRALGGALLDIAVHELSWLALSTFQSLYGWWWSEGS